VKFICFCLLIIVCRQKWKLWCSRCIFIVKVAKVMSREKLEKWKVYFYSLLWFSLPKWIILVLNKLLISIKYTIFSRQKIWSALLNVLRMAIWQITSRNCCQIN
jgi:hypothetical protein